MTDRNWFRVYCEKSSRHCMEYFVMKNRSLIEKCFWILAFFLMTSLTYIVMGIVLDIWINNPNVMFIENIDTGIEEIPFPLITICPLNQMRTWVWEKYKKRNSSHWVNIQQYHSLLCPNGEFFSPDDNRHLTEYLDYDFVKNSSRDCSISCPEMFQPDDVKWQNITVQNFCRYIQPIISSVGVCYTINMLPTYQIFNDEYYQRYKNYFSKNNSYFVTEKSKWNLDDGYSFYSSRDSLVTVLPVRTNGVSFYNSLSFKLNSFKDEFLSCPNLPWADGSFFISLANPTEYFSTKTKSFVIPDSDMKIQIVPYVKKISSNLMWRSLDIRKCYLHNERKLFIFQQYSQINCDHECVLNETISMCGCIGIEWAFLATKGVKICGPGRKNCIKTSLQQAYQPEMQIKCQCLPTCSVLEYEITDTFDYDDMPHFRKSKFLRNNSRSATIEFIFNQPLFAAYKSSSFIGLNSLISGIGGIFSLFLGLNLINCLEILYVILQIVSRFYVHMFKKNNQ